MGKKKAPESKAERFARLAARDPEEINAPHDKHAPKSKEDIAAAEETADDTENDGGDNGGDNGGENDNGGDGGDNDKEKE